MLMADPPYSYTEISAKLGIPVGSIGPQRARCLERLRSSNAFSKICTAGRRPDATSLQTV
jgi:hypothetical protein